MDLRNYGIGAQILRDLNVGRMRLLAKPRKMPSMAGFDLEVTGYESRAAGAQERLIADRRRARARPPVDPFLVHRSHTMPIRRIAPSHNGDGLRVGIVLSRFNAAIGDGLLAGALRALQEAGVADDDITVVSVPGALESPLALQQLAQIGRLRRAGRARRGDPRRDVPFRDRRQRIGGGRCPASRSNSASRSATAS